MRGRRLSFELRNGLTHALLVLTKCPFGLCEVSPTAQHSDTRPADHSCMAICGARGDCRRSRIHVRLGEAVGHGGKQFLPGVDELVDALLLQHSKNIVEVDADCLQL